MKIPKPAPTDNITNYHGYIVRASTITDNHHWRYENISFSQPESVEDDEQPQDEKSRKKTDWRHLVKFERAPMSNFIQVEEDKDLTNEQRLKRRFITYYQEYRKKRTTKVIDTREKSIEDDLKGRIQRFEFLRDVVHYIRTKMTDDDLGTYEEKKFHAQMELPTALSELHWYCENRKEYAEIFVEMYGLERIVYPTFYTDDKGLKAEALRLLDTILRVSNETHLYAVETDSIDKVVESLCNETSPTVRKRAFAALHTHMTKYEEPRIILARKGFQTFNKLMKKGSLISRLDILGIFADHVLEHVIEFERNFTNSTTELFKSNVSRVSIYEDTCRTVRYLLLDTFEQHPKNSTRIGYVLRVMSLLHEICKEYHRIDPKLLITFYHMEEFYLKEIKWKSLKVPTEEYAQIILYLRDYVNAVEFHKITYESAGVKARFVDSII